MTLSSPATSPLPQRDYPLFDIVVRTRVSVDRNVDGFRFPHLLSAEESTEVETILCRAMRGIGFALARVGDMDTGFRSRLAERELYSRQYLLDEGKYVVLSPDAILWMAINDMNHLSIRASRPGLSLLEAWSDVSGTDDALEQMLGQHSWAFDPDIAYLMSRASFCGSGLSAGVTLHTPALALSGLAEMAYKRAMEAGFIVAGAYSSLGVSSGYLFELSLPPVYGDPERTSITRLDTAARSIAEYERRARAELLSSSSWDILDVIGRAAGSATCARLVSRDEASDIVSGLRLGLSCGVLEGMNLAEATELWVSTRIRQTKSDVAPGIQLADMPGEPAKRIESNVGEPEAAIRAYNLRKMARGIGFTQGYKDV